MWTFRCQRREWLPGHWRLRQKWLPPGGNDSPTWHLLVFTVYLYILYLYFHFHRCTLLSVAIPLFNAKKKKNYDTGSARPAPPALSERNESVNETVLLKIFMVQISKAYEKSGAAQAAPAAPLLTALISSDQKPRRRQLNVKVCSSKSANSFFLRSNHLSNNDNSKPAQALTLILAQNCC